MTDKLPEPPGETRARVLLVDDEPLGRKLVALKLGQAGYHVTTASSAEAALALVSSTRFDAIVSDIRMPGMGGFELCGAIRANARFAGLRVLLLSSALDEIDRKKAEALEAECFLRTPDLGELVAALARTVGPGRQSGDASG